MTVGIDNFFNHFQHRVTLLKIQVFLEQLPVLAAPTQVGKCMVGLTDECADCGPVSTEYAF